MKERTPEVKAIRTKARVLAQADGRPWSTLSKEEKVGYLAKAGLPQATSRDEREKAREAAKRAGQHWRELSKEQRQQYLDQIREKAPEKSSGPT